MKIVESLNKLGEIIIPKKWEPIGTIKMFDREQDMSKLYYGTWELTLKERSPIGINPSSAEDRFKTAGNQFGEKEHTLTVNEIPNSFPYFKSTNDGNFLLQYMSANNGNFSAEQIYQTGHNNIHPVEVVYFYKRVA